VRRIRGEMMISGHSIRRPTNIPLSLLLVSLAFFFSPNIPSAEETRSDQAKTNSSVNLEVIRGIDLIYNWEFDPAESLFERLIKENPEDPIGYFYLAMVSWSRLAYGIWTNEMVEQYGRRIKRTVEVAKNAVKKNKADCYAYFYLGGALGFEGRFKLMERKFLSSFFLAQDAIKALKTSLELCPDNQDVLFGMGIFDYYTAKFSGVLKFLSYLLIHRGDKEEGLRKLQSAADGAIYSSIEAKSLLLHIYLYMEEDQYDKALALAVELTERFPDNIRFKFFEGVTYIRLDKYAGYEDVVNFFRKKSSRMPTKNEAFIWGNRGVYLEACYDLSHERPSEARSKLQRILLKADPVSDPFMLAWPLLKIGMCYDLEGKREKALDYYEQVIKLENGAGAQFLAYKYKRKPAVKTDPFLEY
jgi:tetratricopeptide (TPR) repeat protein